MTNPNLSIQEQMTELLDRNEANHQAEIAVLNAQIDDLKNQVKDLTLKEETHECFSEELVAMTAKYNNLRRNMQLTLDREHMSDPQADETPTDGAEVIEEPTKMVTAVLEEVEQLVAEHEPSKVKKVENLETKTDSLWRQCDAKSKEEVLTWAGEMLPNMNIDFIFESTLADENGKKSANFKAFVAKIYSKPVSYEKFLATEQPKKASKPTKAEKTTTKPQKKVEAVVEHSDGTWKETDAKSKADLLKWAASVLPGEDVEELFSSTKVDANNKKRNNFISNVKKAFDGKQEI